MTDMTILYIALAVAILVNVAVRHVLRREPDPVRKVLKLFRSNLVLMAGFCLLLWWQLPITPLLGSFGHPQATADVQSPQSLLRYLQDHNRALIETTNVVSRFLFVFVWWFLMMLLDLSQTLARTSRAATPAPIAKAGGAAAESAG